LELQWANEAGVQWNSPEFRDVHARKIADSDYARLRTDR
jgi:hypothetical protein